MPLLSVLPDMACVVAARDVQDGVRVSRKLDDGIWWGELEVRTQLHPASTDTLSASFERSTNRKLRRRGSFLTRFCRSVD